VKSKSDPTPALRASASFSPAEVTFLDGLISLLLRGGDTRMLMRSKAAKSTMSKVQAMRKRIDEIQAARVLGTPVPADEPEAATGTDGE
jgi:hypothetical protein